MFSIIVFLDIELTYIQISDDRVNAALRLDHLKEDGTLERASSKDFYRGDLVEAIATVDISVQSGKDLVPRTFVYLSFNRATVVTCAHRMDEVSASSRPFFFPHSYDSRSMDVKEKFATFHACKFSRILVRMRTWLGVFRLWYTLTPKVDGVK